MTILCSEPRQESDGCQGARREAVQPWKSTTYQAMHGSPVLTPPTSEALSPPTGMSTRLRRTQARGAGESHAQDANVADVSDGKPVRGEPAYPRQSTGLPGGERMWDVAQASAHLTRPIDR